MALQGTLETFALPDVLRLLASTHKTGLLRVTSAGGSGALWLDGGAIVASEASGDPLAQAATDVLFELLRFKAGDFVFEDEVTSLKAGSPAEVEDSLGAAEAMLEEWKSIESVVPSLAAWVSLRADLPGDEVTIDAQRWRQIIAIGGGTTVSALGDVLGLSELPVSRTVKDLVELGLVEVGDAPADSPAPAHALEPEPAAGNFMPEAEAPVLTVVGDSPSGADSNADRFDPSGLVIEEPVYGSGGTAAVLDGPDTSTSEDDMADAAEIARQLANLSPKAAKAVAAAAKATTAEEREAALAEVDDTEDPINRGLLLKFLGSVNG